MTLKYRHIIILIMIFNVFACYGNDSDPKDRKSISLDFDLEDEMSKAAHGSSGSSQNLIIYYSGCRSDILDFKGFSESDCRSALNKWILQDIKNGGSLGKSIRFNQIIEDTDCSSFKEAKNYLASFKTWADFDIRNNEFKSFSKLCRA